MAFFEKIVGNHALKDRLTSDIESNSLSHAYIIEGPHGSGRHTIALTSVAAIACKNRGQSDTVPCGQCANCRKILSEQSPDVSLISLEEDKASIGIEAIRKIKEDLYVAPNDIDLKVYIIDDADKLTHQAQNALLLSLEEPPSYVLFFLICENSSLLLETVKSRAPTLRTERVSHEELRNYLLSHDSRARELLDQSPDEFNTIIHISDGCIGYGLELLNSRQRKLILDCRRVATDLISMLSSKNRASVFETVVSMGSKRQEISRQIVFLQHAIRDLLLLKKSDEAPLCFYEDAESASELATHFTSKQLVELYDATVQALEDLERNANVRLALISMMKNANLI